VGRDGETALKAEQRNIAGRGYGVR